MKEAGIRPFFDKKYIAHGKPTCPAEASTKKPAKGRVLRKKPPTSAKLQGKEETIGPSAGSHSGAATDTARSPAAASAAATTVLARSNAGSSTEFSVAYKEQLSAYVKEVLNRELSGQFTTIVLLGMEEAKREMEEEVFKHTVDHLNSYIKSILGKQQ
jgi:hypothetical protein